MQNSDFLVIGGDRRQTYCAKILEKCGHTVSAFLVPGLPSPSFSHTLLQEYVMASKYILCPMPFSKDTFYLNTIPEHPKVHLFDDLLPSLLKSTHTLIGGAIPEPFAQSLTKNDIAYYDLMDFKSLTYANACLTAEGLLKDLIENVPFGIAGADILILGFGNCGSAIARLLDLLGANITVYNRNPYYEAKAKALGFTTINSLPADNYLSGYSIIINTIPNIIYTNEHLAQTDTCAYLFEVASAPGGFDMEYINKHKMHYKNCPGIPGKTSPKTAARTICNVILNEIGCR